jgi:hypothetical protein
VQDSFAQSAMAVHPQMRSAVALHAVVSIEPTGHVVEHVAHALPLR